MQGFLGRQYVEGSLCEKMPALMKKDVEKLLDDNASLRLTAQRFTKKEQEVMAAKGPADSPGTTASPSQNGHATELPSAAQVYLLVIILTDTPDSSSLSWINTSYGKAPFQVWN